MDNELDPGRDLDKADAAGAAETASATEQRDAARRKFLKVGLGVAVPVVLTIKSRPAWGAEVQPGCASILASLTHSAHGTCGTG